MVILIKLSAFWIAHMYTQRYLCITHKGLTFPVYNHFNEQNIKTLHRFSIVVYSKHIRFLNILSWNFCQIYTLFRFKLTIRLVLSTYIKLSTNRYKFNKTHKTSQYITHLISFTTNSILRTSVRFSISHCVSVV